MGKLHKELKKLVSQGIKGSLEKQDKVFQATARNRKLFEKAVSLATY